MIRRIAVPVLTAVWLVFGPSVRAPESIASFTPTGLGISFALVVLLYGIAWKLLAVEAPTSTDARTDYQAALDLET